MPERPDPERRPDRQGSDFGWLYGKDAPEPSADAPREDATRPMPTDQRRARAGATYSAHNGSRPASRPTPPPIAPTPGGAGSGGGSGRSRGRFWRPRRVVQLVGLLIVAWIAYLVLVPIFAWKSVDQVAFAPGGDRPAAQPGTTYLMVGSDSRAGLTKKQRKRLSTGDAAGQRTDTIMLLHTGSGPNVLMSIPRDSLVPIPGHGTAKINAAFAWGGPKLLVQTIEQNTGIRIDDYVEIGFGGLVKTVNAVGGITICPTTAMNDPLAGLHIKAGCQHAGGVKALGYARSRHTQALGDIGRAQHQREVVSAIGKKVASPMTVINPFRYWKLLHAVPDLFTFGDGTSAFRAAEWASAMTHVNGKNGLTCGIPISDLAVHWDHARALRLINYIKTDHTADIPASLCTPSGLPKSVTG
ncbi:LCP family protein [Nocardioides sp.]|jgi:LCP family protein required for cell wall assembly|uniref:LCP family protein n=1 Tax=Nocardioides sp. TaxID=35761 RepID=UPI002BC2A716|nr:LCP family protein [Nocardioides sp.]HVX53404.1 LCP family protein [Nocardioides sp.]